jgi:hypothetical protein
MILESVKFGESTSRECEEGEQRFDLLDGTQDG